MEHLRIDRGKTAARLGRDIETLSGPAHTRSDEAISRYAYTDEYRATVAYFARELEAIGLTVEYDPVGTLVARNVPKGVPAFGIGSHCDSNRNGGKWDGTLGVAMALEICRLNHEHGLGLPLQLISFLEEEGSGFGQMLLGSRIMAHRVTEEQLKEIRELDTGRSFWEAATAAGYPVEQWRESAGVLDGLIGWIEPHIEQARVLQDTGSRIGIVRAIAGCVHADLHIHGRDDHAGATPMDFRLDPTTVLAECILELERLARAAGRATVGTVGEIEVQPCLINAIARRVRCSLDIRGPVDEAYLGVFQAISAYAHERAAARGMTVEVVERHRQPATPMDTRIVAALEVAAAATGEAVLTMHSGAAHDTMCIAGSVPTAMVFVPCKDGISHSPAEAAEPEDAAVAVEAILNAIRALV